MTQVGLMAGSINWVSMPAFLVTGAYSCAVYVKNKLAVSSLAAGITIVSTHFAYPWKDGQAELAWVAWLNVRTVTANVHPSQY